ncbi:MAG: Hsp20/alpha crystallin family protein [Deltaproteobacteria bacterium]|nr:Hsp20/alpha crystallin family protein [Deltaproteobacteria bacterium]
MATWQQLREGVSRAWDSLMDGWHQLYERASGAMTRFVPGTGKANSAGPEQQEIVRRSSGWGLLAAEVSDDAKRVIVRLEAPGLEPDEIDLQVLNNLLVVRGEKHIQREHDDDQFHVLECAYGRFERAIPLPAEVDSERARASYKHGVLKVELPKLKEQQRQGIRIKVA